MFYIHELLHTLRFNNLFSIWRCLIVVKKKKNSKCDCSFFTNNLRAFVTDRRIYVHIIFTIIHTLNAWTILALPCERKSEIYETYNSLLSIHLYYTVSKLILTVWEKIVSNDCVLKKNVYEWIRRHYLNIYWPCLGNISFIISMKH